ncbi:MAG: PQQ-like beta-propeller repeat protein [Planctomycetes bacterium]|nr:PQQ-like beta-propeller repeat protein [Planctomycetota bacterium]
MRACRFGRHAQRLSQFVSLVVAGWFAPFVYGQTPTSTTPYTVRFHSKPKPLSPRAVTQDWPDFLGPNRDAISRETRLLKRFPKSGPALVWEMETGRGYAAPSVAGNRLVFMHRVSDEVLVECLHPESGDRYWAFRYPTGYKDRYNFGDGPRATPVIDGDRVYTCGASGTLHCLELKTGKPIWKHDFMTEHSVPQDFFGVASTPLVEGDLLIVNVGAPGGPSVIAYDKHTGRIIWRAGKEWGASCASPVAATLHGRRRVFVFAGGISEPPTGGLLSIDPISGSIDFRFPFRSQRYESVNAATPVVVGDQVFVTTDYRTGCALLNITSSGEYKVAWKNESLLAHFVTPIHHDGHLYGLHGAGGQTALVCVNLESGKRMWEERPLFDVEIERDGRKQTVSVPLKSGGLLYADGDFLLLNERGQLVWLDLSPKGYREISRATLFSATESWTPPVISRGLLYVTQNTKDKRHNTPPRLLCYDLRAAD